MPSYARTAERTLDIPVVDQWPRMAPSALDQLDPLACTVTVRSAQQIYRHDDRTEFCWTILTGCARLVRFMEDGRRQVAKFMWPGDLVGIDDVGTYNADAEAVTDMILRRYPRSAVEATARSNAALALQLRLKTLTNLQRADQHIILLGRKTAVEKIASFLLDLDRRSLAADCGFVELPMDRTDIADHLCLSIETVCRCLAMMHRSGILKSLRSGIVLLDRTMLVELARE